MELVSEVRDALGDPALSSEADVLRVQAQIGWIVWSRIAARLDRDEVIANESASVGLLRQAELAAIPGDFGREIGWSEFQVRRVAAHARRLRDRTPTVWTAFRDGQIDEAKAREISSAAEKLERPASIARLDRQVLAYATTHTLTELRRWLRLFVARVEADLFNERAERDRNDRGVDVVHGDNGMSWLTLYGTSPMIAAVDKRLTKEAKAFGADDPRTLQQRRADLAAAWLTTNERGEPAVNADIAVMLQASTMAGADDLPAVSADGNWLAPAAWILDLARNAKNNVFWHRMVLDPATDNVLAHEYVGRYAPDILSKALAFRDGVCQASGCCRPAHECDMDHRIPHEADGPTSGWNIGPYCRRHHKLKGFGLIDVGPTVQGPPGQSRNTPLHSVGMPEPSGPPIILIEFAYPDAA